MDRTGANLGPDRPVIFLAQVFPRSLDDPLGAFLLHLAQALAPRVPVEAVAPHAAGLSEAQAFLGIPVHRFRYAPDSWERLAYTGEMHVLVARRWSNKLLFGLFNLAFLRETVALVRKRHARLIHAHWWMPGGLVGALASILTGTPLVITTHGTDVDQLRRTRAARPLARFVFGRAAAVTCGSTYLRDRLLELGIVTRAPITVAPMPVSPTFVPAEKAVAGDRRSAAGGPSSVILTVARLTAQKSIDTLLQALAILRGRGCPARLVIVGDGPARSELERQTDALGLRDRVEFLGTRRQEDLPALYATCDVFVLPSIREGTGLVLVEAMLCGAPAIASDTGGVTDIVKEGETGLTFPAGDAPALAAAIERLLEDPALAARLAAAGRAWGLEHFTPARAAAQFWQVYENATTYERR